MVLCDLCKPCVHYNRALEVCDAMHSSEMLCHPDYCKFREVKEEKKQ